MKGTPLNTEWPSFPSRRDPVEMLALTPEAKAAVESRDAINNKLDYLLRVSVVCHNTILELQAAIVKQAEAMTAAAEAAEQEARNAEERKWTTAKKAAAVVAGLGAQVGISVIVHALTKT